MAIGLSTYSFFWRWTAAQRPLSLTDMVERTAEAGATVFQICDYPPIEEASDGELERLRRRASALGVRLELGTRGVDGPHLARYLDLAGRLDVGFVRTMLNTAAHRPTVAEAVTLLVAALPGYAARGVTIGLETYEQVATDDLLAVVRGVDDPHLGVCLDPANCVARLELPATTVERTAPYVVNLHVKDFAFTRAPGWVGFSLVGCPLGTGLLDYAAMVARVRPAERGINQIVEHWLPRQESIERTCAVEDEWTRHSVEFLRRAGN
ncbi:sugar phosphate isomerase/epimerase family protein [Micromonospora haikouensis]|uniref:sugar phosphate isomerase/epimerase family protein n=1 Tax=Micromonospora haikouensis TaxID=686309 RepID=UPI0037A9861F